MASDLDRLVIDLQARLGAAESTIKRLGDLVKNLNRFAMGGTFGTGTVDTYVVWGPSSIELKDSSYLKDIPAGVETTGDIIPNADLSASLGTDDPELRRYLTAFAETFLHDSTHGILWGTGDPTPTGSAVVADVGTIYLQKDGSEGEMAWFKEADDGAATGWTPGFFDGADRYLSNLAMTDPDDPHSSLVQINADLYPAAGVLIDIGSVDEAFDGLYISTVHTGGLGSFGTAAGTVTPIILGDSIKPLGGLTLGSTTDPFLSVSSTKFLFETGVGFFHGVTDPASGTLTGYGPGWVYIEDDGGGIWIKDTASSSAVWTRVGAGSTTGSGAINYLAKFTPNTTTIGSANIIDDGVNVSLVHPADDWVQLGFATTDITGPTNHLAIWRYEHRVSGLAENVSSPNIASGEMQLFLQSSTPSVLFGAQRSYFTMGLGIKLPTPYSYPAFVVTDNTGAPTFSIAPDGNLTMVRKVTYDWPTDFAYPADGEQRVLGFTNTSGVPVLAWLLPAGTGGGSGNVTGSGSTNWLAKWTGAESIAKSNIFDDGTNITATCKTLISLYPVDPVAGDDDLAQIGWQTAQGNYAIWRYEHRVAGILGGSASPNLVSGEAQLFLNDPVNPSVWLGANRSYLRMGLTVLPPTSYPDSAFAIVTTGSVLRYQVMPDGNLSIIKSVPYNWPDATPVPAAGKSKVLGYSNTTGIPLLQWMDPPASAGVITGSGTINQLAKFTAADVLGNSGVRDNGSTVYVERRFVIDSFKPEYATDPANNDLSEAVWALGSGLNAIWRYEHRVSGLIGGALGPNLTTGEMQLFLNSIDPCVWLGQQRSFFRMGIEIVPPTGYADSAFSINAPVTNATLFQLQIDGDLAVIKSVGYHWPDSTPFPTVSGAMKVLAYTSTASPVSLAWVDFNPSASGIVGPGNLNYIAKFTPDGSTVKSSNITDDGTIVQVNTKQLVVKQLDPAFEESEIAFAASGTSAPKRAIWRYEPRLGVSALADEANNPDGQMELFINDTTPCVFLGKGSSWFECGVYIRMPSSYGGAAFEIQDSTPAAKFRVEQSGNLSIIKGASYVWPDDHAAGVLTSTAGGGLSWTPLPSVMTGRTGYFPIFTGGGTGPLGDVSHLVEDVTNFHLAYNEVPTEFHAFLIRPNDGDNGVVVFPRAATTGKPFAYQKDSSGNGKFQVDADGNLLFIRNVQYLWPAGHAVGSLVSDLDGNLSWTVTNSGTVAGTPNTVAKFTAPTVVGNSNITDNGAHVVVSTDLRVTNLGFDLSDIFWETNTGASAYWRYEHRSGNVDPVNVTSGEFQTIFGGMTGQTFGIGVGSAYFTQTVKLKGVPFIIYDVGYINEVFRVESDGDLSIIRKQPYQWPTGNSSLVGLKILQFNPADHTLAWVPPPSPASPVTGESGHFPIFGADHNLADISHLAEDATNKRLAFNENPFVGGNTHAFLVRPNGDDNGVVVYPQVASTGRPFAYQAFDGSGKFQVDAGGNLAFIRDVSYSWPTSHAAGSLVSDAMGHLSWTPTGTGTVGPGSAPHIAKFTAAEVIENANITDDNSFIRVFPSLRVVNTSTANDVTDLFWDTNFGATGFWRYEHRSAQVDPANVTLGEFQAWFGASSPIQTFGIGAGAAYFTQTVRLKGVPLIGYDVGYTAEVFRVEPDGDLSIIRRRPYHWPTDVPSAGLKILQLNPADNQLAWVPPPSPASPVTGAPGHYPVFGADSNLADIGHLAEDMTAKRLAFNENPFVSGNQHAFLIRPNADDNGVVVFPRAPSTGSPFAYQDSAGGHKFQVDWQGNLAYISNQQYVWPTSVPAPGATGMVLGYANTGIPLLQWMALPPTVTVPSNVVVGSGPQGVHAKFTINPTGSTIGPSIISDDGTTALVTGYLRVANPFFPLADIFWQANDGHEAALRYERRLDQIDSLNGSGEYQVFIDNGPIVTRIGANVAHFAQKVMIHGDLGMINNINYYWPGGYSPGAGWYLSSSTDGHLSWAQLPAGVSIPIDNVTGTGAVNRLAKFTTDPTGSTIGNSIISADGATAFVDGNLRVHNPAAQTADVFWQVSDGHDAYWRYDRRPDPQTDPANTTGEFQVVIDGGPIVTRIGASVVHLAQQVQIHGDLRKINDIQYFWPNNHSPGAGWYLSSTTDGHLSWVQLPAGVSIPLDNLTGVGTPGKHARYATSTTLGDSIISDDTATATVGGHLRIVGDLGLINNVAYQWPGGHALADDYYLASSTGGVLQWKALPLGVVIPIDNVTGGGTTNKLAMWSGVHTLADSVIADNGSSIISSRTNFVVHDPSALDVAQLFLQGSSDVYGAWRFTHTAGATDPTGNPDGEMQLLLQDNNTRLAFGRHTSYFSMGLRVRPGVGGYAPFTAEGSSGNATFRVDLTGNLGLIYGVGYTWPDSAPGTGNKFLQYNAGILNWVDAPTVSLPPTMITGPVAGTTNQLAKFTGTTTIGDSAVKDDGASIIASQRDLHVVGGVDFSQVSLQTSGGPYGMWRYSLTNILPGNSSGEMQLLITDSQPYIMFGTAASFLGTSLVVRSGATYPFEIWNPSSVAKFRIDSAGNPVLIKGQAYNWPDNNVAGVLTCAGGGALSWQTGYLIGSGTPGKHARYATSTMLGDSVISDDGATAVVSGHLRIVGDLGLINNVSYQWPGGHAAVNDYYLASSTDGVLQWKPIPPGAAVPIDNVTGTGTINYLAKFTATGSVVGNAIITESGTIATVHGSLAIAQPSADVTDLFFQVQAGKQSFWRYSGGAVGGAGLNATDGEMQLWFDTPSGNRFGIGKNVAYFTQSVAVKDNTLAVTNAVNTPLFQVASNGNLGTINGWSGYVWPTNHGAAGPAPVYVLSNNGSGALSWLPIPLSGSGNVSVAAPNGTDADRMPKWSATFGTLLDSAIEDRTVYAVGPPATYTGTVEMDCSQFVLKRGTASDEVIDFYMRTSSNASAIWRYERRAFTGGLPGALGDSANSDEVQMHFGNFNAIPLILGNAHSWFYSGLRLKPIASGAGNPLEIRTAADAAAFYVEPDGNLLWIRGRGYQWPGNNDAGVLTNAGGGNLSWSPALQGAGLQNTLAKFVSPDVPSTGIGNSHIVDDGSTIAMSANLVTFTRITAVDAMELQLIGTSGAKCQMRYQHADSALGDSGNISGSNGEMQFFLNGTTTGTSAHVFFGAQHSWFQMGLRVRPPLGYTDHFFEIRKMVTGTTDAAVFRVRSDGDLAVIKGQPYVWPDSSTTTAGWFLQNNGTGGLQWAAAGGLSGGTSGYVLRWTGANTVTGISSIYDDGTQVAIKQNLLPFGGTFPSIGTSFSNAFVGVWATNLHGAEIEAQNGTPSNPSIHLADGNIGFVGGTPGPSNYMAMVAYGTTAAYWTSGGFFFMTPVNGTLHRLTTENTGKPVYWE